RGAERIDIHRFALPLRFFSEPQRHILQRLAPLLAVALGIDLEVNAAPRLALIAGEDAAGFALDLEDDLFRRIAALGNDARVDVHVAQDLAQRFAPFFLRGRDVGGIDVALRRARAALLA